MTNIGVFNADSLRTANSLRTATLVSIFSAASASLYGAADVEPSPAVSYFFSAAPLVAVIWWLERDSGRTGVATVQDFGMFAWCTWPLLIPWYMWKTRQWAGWRLGSLLYLLILSPYVGFLIGPWIFYALKYAVWYWEWGDA